MNSIAAQYVCVVYCLTVTYVFGGPIEIPSGSGRCRRNAVASSGLHPRVPRATLSTDLAR